MANEFLDFEIQVKQRAEGELIVRVNSQGARAEHLFSNPFNADRLALIRQTLTAVALRSSARVRSSSLPEKKVMKEVGGQLFENLISGPVKDLYIQAQTQARQQDKGLRLRLVLDPSVSELPWEFLCSSQMSTDFLALDPYTPIVRFVEKPIPTSALKTDLPLRVLVVIASPIDQTPLDTEAEKRRIESALKPLQEQGLVHVTYLEGPDTWLRLIDTLRPNATHVLHFIGHGMYDTERQEGTLVMEDESGNSKFIGSDQLHILVQGKTRLRLVVLNSCLGTQASEGEPFSSAAVGLIRSGVPAVIAMQFEVSDQAAQIIAETFYKSLAMNFPVDAALTEARRQVFLQDSDCLEWATPVLFMQVPDGHLFDLAEATIPSPSKPPTPEPDKVPDTAVDGVDFEQQAEKRYKEGVEAESRGDWGEAISAFEGVLFVAPGYKDTTKRLEAVKRRHQCAQLYERAEKLYANHEYSRALETMAQIHTIDPGWADPADLQTLSECGQIYQQAIQELKNKNRERGAELLRQVINRRRNFADAARRLQNLSEGGDGLFGMSVQVAMPQESGVEETMQPSMQQLPKGWTARVYQVSGIDKAALAEELRQYFLSNNYETQTLPQGNNLVVQGRKGGMRALVGMSLAATTIIEPSSDGLRVLIGGGKWLDKIGAAAVSMIVLWPLLLTSGLGAWQQKDLIDSLWRVVDSTIISHGGKRSS